MKPFPTAICAALVALTACTTVPRPSYVLPPDAGLVAEHLTLHPEPVDKTVRWLKARGYKPAKRTSLSEVWPRTGFCYQKRTQTIRLYGIRIVRVCFAGNRHPVVLERNTKGRYWTEVYPRDLTHNLYGPSGLGRISDQTVELLDQ